MPKKAIEERYTPINKGHFELEPAARINRFQEILADGWESDYLHYRKLWSELPKNKVTRKYPLLVDLELASKCNLSCPMCPTVTDKFRVLRQERFPSGLMDIDLIRRIIDEVHLEVYSLRLSWVGEPTLHPNLIDAVAYAKKKGIREVSFLTNGSRLHLGYMKKMMAAGLDQMTVSIDGMEDEYNRIRAPLKFNKTLDKLRKLKQYKNENGVVKPAIKVQGVWPAIRENAQQYYDTFMPITDLIAFNPLIDYLHKDVDIEYEDSFSCPQIYQRVTVSADGRVALCANDDLVQVVLGDAKKSSIYDIWHGEKMEEMRHTHRELCGFKKIRPCLNCYYPRTVEKTESAIINGNKFVIENYVNRKQEVGQ